MIARRPHASAGFVFAPSGSRLYTRAEDGSLLEFHIPNSSRSTTHPPRTFTPGEGQLVAVGQLLPGRRTVAVTQSADALHLFFFDEKLRRARSVRVPLGDVEIPNADPRSPLAALGVMHAAAMCFINQDGSLVTIVRDTLEVLPTPPVAPPLTSFPALRGAVKAFPEGLGFTSNSSGGQPHGQVFFVVAGHRCIRVENYHESYEPTPPGGPVFFGIRGIASTMAWQGTDGQWFVKPSRRAERVPPDVEIFGLIERGDSEPEAHLAAIDASRTTIGCFARSAFHPIHQSAARIAVAATSSAARHLAYLTESGELVILSYDTGAELVRLT